MRWICAALLCLSISFAQKTSELNTSKEVAAQINSASSSVFLSAPALYDFDVSDALRRASVRGVEVYILVGRTLVESPDNYAPGMAAAQLGGASITVRLGSALPSVVIIDDDLLVEGPLVTQDSTAFDGSRTYVLRDANDVKRRSEQLRPLWTSATDYISFIEYLSIDLADF